MFQYCASLFCFISFILFRLSFLYYFVSSIIYSTYKWIFSNAKLTSLYLNYVRWDLPGKYHHGLGLGFDNVHLNVQTSKRNNFWAQKILAHFYKEYCGKYIQGRHRQMAWFRLCLCFYYVYSSLVQVILHTLLFVFFYIFIVVLFIILMHLSFNLFHFKIIAMPFLQILFA